MFDIFGKRYYFFAVSIIVILAGFVAMLINGVKLDIQFQGGTIMRIEMADDNYNASEIETVLSQEFGKNITAQKQTTLNPDKQNEKINLLTLKVSKESTLNDDERARVVTILREKYNVSPEAQMSVLSVEPFIGAELLRKGIQAALISMLLIVIYVWWRFKVLSLSAAIFGIVALIHDALVMLAAYTIFQIPVNESFIAAVLMILGYSINDTVIIYDRIRENLRLTRKMPLDQLVNTSIIQTLSRSINTTITTLLCVLAVLIFASVNKIQSLTDFAFPMTVGIVSGSYSTIFIAGPLWVMWKNYRNKRVKGRKPAKA